MQFSVLTSFPEYFDRTLKASILGRAHANKLVKTEVINLREFGEGNYKAIDDRPFGGGPGMILMPSIVEKALEALASKCGFSLDELQDSVEHYKANNEFKNSNPNIPYIVFLTPQGIRLNSKICREFSKISHVVLLCGHYEGIDERIYDLFCHQGISIGDFVVTGGEVPALLLMDAVSRFIPGVLGDLLSANQDSFENFDENYDSGLKAPSYTRPKVWRGLEVPDVLLSGNHKAIKAWRLEQSKKRTLASKKRRS